jgi:hypothetical protein
MSPNMLNGLKRFFSGDAPAPAPVWEDVAQWAVSTHHVYREVPGEGFVIDGQVGGTPWRLEWGPSQRSYIACNELRIRAELGLSPDLQLVLLNRALQEAMEKAVFEQCVEGVQTRIDNQTPPEVRWLVMYPKLSGAQMPLLRERYAALSSVRGWLLQWLDGPLTPALAELTVPADLPLVLMIGRGRLMLRTAVADAQVAALQGWLRLFETALREARRLEAAGVLGAAGDDLQTAPSLWPPSGLPGEERR